MNRKGYLTFATFYWSNLQNSKLLDIVNIPFNSRYANQISIFSIIYFR